MRVLAHLLVAALLVVAAATPARAAPTADALAARAKQLEQRLHGRGFTVVVEPPFVVVGDEAPARVRKRASGTLRWTVNLLRKDYFARDPDEIIEVWLFKDEKSYRKGARAYFDDDPDTPYGYYQPAQKA